MSNDNYWDDDEDDNAGSNEPSDAIKALRKKTRADAKLIEELTAKLDGLSKVQRESTVKSVLEKKGINPKMARLILKDVDDVTEESLEAWLTENADIIPGPKKPSLTPDEQAELEALEGQDDLTRGGGLPGSGNSLIDKLDDPNLTKAEFDALMLQATQ